MVVKTKQTKTILLFSNLLFQTLLLKSRVKVAITWFSYMHRCSSASIGMSHYRFRWLRRHSAQGMISVQYLWEYIYKADRFSSLLAFSTDGDSGQTWSLVVSLWQSTLANSKSVSPTLGNAFLRTALNSSADKDTGTLTFLLSFRYNENCIKKNHYKVFVKQSLQNIQCSVSLTQ